MQARRSPPSHRSFFSQAGLVIGVFVLGAAAGLAVTMSMKDPAGTQALQAAGAGRPADDAGRSAPLGGAASDDATSEPNPNELPYDGMPPRSTQQAPAAATVDANKLPYADGDIRPKEGGQVAAAPAKKAAAARALTDADASSHEGGSGSAGITAAGSGEESISPPPSPRPGAKADDKKEAKTAQRPKTAQRIAKDKEIERIKRQAADELKKKTSDGRLAAQSSVKTASQNKKTNLQGNRRSMLAQCSNASNIFLRERCKWQVCGGMWGKEGCPSYDRQANPNY